MTLTARHKVVSIEARARCGIRALALGISLLWCMHSSADDLQELSVTDSAGEYSVRIVSVLNAPSDYVYEVITDYRHTYRISPSIVKTEILPSGRKGWVRLHNLSEHWVGPFCFHIDWVGDILATSPNQIVVNTVPELSDFESGYAVWQLTPQGERTRVVHESTLKPKFFVPPAIGNMILKTKMRDETRATFRRIECISQLMIERDLEQDPALVVKFAKEHGNCNKPPS